ncbi:MAG: type II toxin-antitoxin system RelE/ParE family toxin [Verrucomicrobiota bacterium]
MIPYSLRPRAKEDLTDIADYTFDTWGADQEELYLRMLQRSLESLSKNPTLGRPIDEVIPGLRRLLAGQHIILYFASDKLVDIARILHHSMDITKYSDDLANH